MIKMQMKRPETYAVMIEVDENNIDFVREHSSWNSSTPVKVFLTREAAQEEAYNWNTGVPVIWNSGVTIDVGQKHENKLPEGRKPLTDEEIAVLMRKTASHMLRPELKTWLEKEKDK